MKRLLSLILLLICVGGLLAFEPPISLKQASNYVVIGAFTYQKNAIRFTEKAKKDQFDAHFEINKNRKLFYVYVLNTEDRQKAFEQAQSLRAESPFFDTWVYTGLLGEGSEESFGTDVNPETGKNIKQIIADDKTGSKSETAVADQANKTVTNQQTTENNTATITDSTPTSVNATPLSLSEDDKDGRVFFFKITKASNQKEVTGDVNVIDQDKQKTTASYTGNKDVFVRSVNSSGNVLLKCEVFGYRKLEHAINFKEPEASEGVTVENGKVTVPFDLVRLKKGDIAVMYNVFFFKDAAIMRPESRSEVTSLLEMMKENPKMKIKIHGHTNGGAAGKIIEVGDSKNFFSLSDTKEGYGSAKKLSEERAQLINDYLLSEGVEQTRMQIKAWGGKKPIYESDHSKAHNNVRVEIEILEDGN